MSDSEQGISHPYRCPVCGYLGITQADPNGPWRLLIWSYDICPCCGTEFGYDVDGDTPEELQQSIEKRRDEWIRGGHSWFSQARKPPPDWDWKKELRAIAVEVGDE